MAKYTVDLPLEAAYFYEAVAQRAGLRAERVMADALFKLAGELSLEAIHKKEADKGKKQGG